MGRHCPGCHGHRYDETQNCGEGACGPDEADEDFDGCECPGLIASAPDIARLHADLAFHSKLADLNAADVAKACVEVLRLREVNAEMLKELRDADAWICGHLCETLPLLTAEESGCVNCPIAYNHAMRRAAIEKAEGKA